MPALPPRTHRTTGACGVLAPLRATVQERLGVDLGGLDIPSEFGAHFYEGMASANLDATTQGRVLITDSLDPVRGRGTRVEGPTVGLVGQPDQRPIVSASVVVDVGALAEAIDIELQAGGSPQRAEKEQAYLKSTLRHYGTSVPSIRGVAKATSRRHPDVTHDQLVALVEVLWAEPVHERRMACVELLDLYCDRLGPPDIALLERFLRESRTWALVDGLAASVVGRLVERYPELTAELDRWAADSDFWLRRSALLALLIPLRQGRGDFDRFGRYADAMLDEHEFFVRKAIGWVLRDTGRERPDLVYEWLLQRAARASGVTIREAVKPLSAAQRAAIVAAR